MAGLFAGLANSKSDSFAARVIFDVYASWRGEKGAWHAIGYGTYSLGRHFPLKRVASFLESALLECNVTKAVWFLEGAIEVWDMEALDMSEAQQLHIVAVLLEVILPQYHKVRSELIDAMLASDNDNELDWGVFCQFI